MSVAILSVENIERRDPVSGAVLLHPTNLQLRAGEHAVVMGPSGSGKSVLMRSLALLDAIDGGELRYFGEPVAASGVPAYRCRVAYIAQQPGLFPGTVEDNLRLPYTLREHRQRRFDPDAVVLLLEATGRPASFLGKATRDLSGGEAELLNLLRVLQLDPTILLLDEPTSALDAAAAAMVESLVSRWARRKPAEAATIWVTHDPAQARRVGNRFFRMDGSRLEELAGPPAAAEASMPGVAA
jgi:putative ABC transport system ATP-binding protein